MTDTEQILKAIQESRSDSEERHRKLWAAIPQDHQDVHKKIDAFMGRLDGDEHLNHHEFIAPWQHSVGIIKDQIAKNVGNVVSVIIGLGGLIYLGQLVGLIPK